MGKRGMSQIDWVISMAIFVIFLMMFFMFIRPKLLPANNFESFTSIAEQGFKKDVYWSVYSVPLFVNSNIDGNEILIADFPLNWSDFYSQSYFDYFDNKIFLVSNLSKNKTSMFNFVYSGDNYSKNFVTKLFVADNESFSNSAMDVQFDDFMPSSLTYNSHKLISGFDYADFEANSFALNQTNLLADYKASSSVINHSCFLISNFSRIYCFVSSDKTNVESFDFSFKTHLSPDFDSYKVINKYNLTYGCQSLGNISFINFDGSDDIGLFFNPDADVNFCYDNSSLDLEINFVNVSSFDYSVFAHNNVNITNYILPFSYDFGMVSEQKGISLEKLNSISNSSPQNLKIRWDFPIDNQFSFEVYNLTYDNQSNKTIKTNLAAYNQSSPADVEDVYASSFQDFILDKFNKLSNVEVIIKTW